MTRGTVLLVDGNQQVRALVAEHLQQVGCAVWVADDGAQAARQMLRELPALVLVDNNVPLGGIDTVRILRLHPRFQNVNMVVVTSGARREVEALIGRAAEFRIGIFKKPYGMQQVVERLQGASASAVQLDRLSLVGMRKELANLSKLPALNPLHTKLLGLLSEPNRDTDIGEVTRTIEADQGLASAILRVCRTVRYGFRGKTISSAITFIGLDRVRSIAQSTIVLNVFKDDGKEDFYGFSLVELWRHSIACGLIMEMGRQYVSGSDHFLAGILHDIGKAILRLRFPNHFKELLRKAEQENRTLISAERELLGFTHADIGFELARAWNLAPAVSMAIAFHHNPQAASLHRRLAALVHVADVKAREFAIGFSGDRQKLSMSEFARRVVLNCDRIDNHRDEIAQRVDAMLSEGRVDEAVVAA